MRPIVCPSCLWSPSNPSEVIIYSKPHRVGESSHSSRKKHKSVRSQTFPNRCATTPEKPLWSLKLLIRRVFGGGGHHNTCCQPNSNVNCYQKKKVLIDVERKHKIMQRDVVRARRTAFGTIYTFFAKVIKINRIKKDILHIYRSIRIAKKTKMLYNLKLFD